MPICAVSYCNQLTALVTVLLLASRTTAARSIVPEEDICRYNAVEACIDLLHTHALVQSAA